LAITGLQKYEKFFEYLIVRGLFFRKLSENLYESKIIAYLCTIEKSKNEKVKK
jgi:hypothetical protein